MDWGVFTRLIDELVANGTEEIGLFFIGEPMLAKLLEDAIRYCKQAGVQYVFITTNGALATAERVEPLMRAGLNSLKFSYNYTDGAQIKEVAHVPEKVFDKLVANIKAVRKMRDAGGYDCGIYASSINFTGKQGELMRQAVDLIKDDVDEHYWLPQYSFGAQTTFGDQVFGNPGRLSNLRDPMPCWTIFKEGHVTAGGSVALCCFDVHDKWTAGNVNSQSFMEAWHSESARALRRAHLAKDVHGTACEACVYGGARRDADKRVIEIVGVPV
jgi:radical SAM protein with 4Fe4S-binding SPASM domain